MICPSGHARRSPRDITLVEFFDYNCGYCKRAAADTEALLGADSHVRFVLKEFPILGPRSVDAAQVAVAAACRMRRATNISLFTGNCSAFTGSTQDAALAAARENGFDMERLHAT